MGVGRAPLAHMHMHMHSRRHPLLVTIITYCRRRRGAAILATIGRWEGATRSMRPCPDPVPPLPCRAKEIQDALAKMPKLIGDYRVREGLIRMPPSAP